MVATFRTRLEAESAAGLLVEAGIPYVIQSAEGMGAGPLPQGTRLLVREDQVKEAGRILTDAGVIRGTR